MEPIETIEHAGCTIRTYYDEGAENPRTTFDEACTMACWHSRYDLGDKHGFQTPDDFREYIKGEPGAAVLPLFLYDHGGITISTGAFPCPWDSGQVGWAYMTPETIRHEYSVKRISAKTRARAEELIRGEVRVYDMYLRGEVYGYTVEDADGETVGSCWGYFGDGDGMMDAAKAEAEAHRDTLRHVRQSRLKEMIRNRAPLEVRATA